jgi:hypothetical protein
MGFIIAFFELLLGVKTYQNRTICMETAPFDAKRKPQH